MHIVVGIDEAGRGPLVGPMIIAGVALPEHVLDKLKRIGVTDSKELTRADREKLYDEIVRLAVYIVVVEVPPETIDNVNLNTLEHDTILFIIERVSELIRPARVSVDAVGPPEKLEKLLRRKLGDSIDVRVSSGAEKLYPEVAAASIIAKVERDRRIAELARVYGDFGSGYPTDPRTVEWVRKMYRLSPDNPPPIVRRTWSTLKRLAPKWYRPKAATGSKTLLDYL